MILQLLKEVQKNGSQMLIRYVQGLKFLEFFEFGFEYDDGTKNIIENPKFSPKISPKFHHFEIKYQTRWDQILPRES